MKPVGYVGLGDMGGALARRLQLARPLMVYDLNAAAVQRLVDRGAVAAAGLPQLAEECDTVFLCLPTSAHVRKAVFGEAGLLQALGPGKRIVDQTTGDPQETRAMGRELAGRNIELIDAPVSGGAVAAEAGTIAIMVGAEPERFAEVESVLRDISPNVFRAGGIGAGHMMKLVNNLLSGAQRVLTLECLALAAKSGIAPAEAVRILMAGGGRNVFLEKGVGPVLAGDLGGGFSLELMHKDIDLACRAGNDVGMPMFYGSVTREMYRLGLALVGKDKRVNNVALAIDRIAQSHLVPEDYDQG